MKKNKLITPEGTKDYLFEEAITRKNIQEKLRKLFEQNSFYEVVTPNLEFLDVFNAKGHSIPTEFMYKLVDFKGRLMAVRPDSTMPIARLYATRLKAEILPLRLYYNQSVNSMNKTMSGRSDEIMQAGIELIGKSGLKADLEVLNLAIKSLMNCTKNDFRIEIGHIGIFNSLMQALNADDEMREQIRLSIETKNYPELNDLLDGFGDKYEANVLKQLPRLFGGEAVFDKALKLINNTQTVEILSYLKKIYTYLKSMGYADKITVDLGIVNRTDYYTGIVFKGYIEGCGKAALSGGRYDTLLSEFGAEAGAVGFAINVDAVASAALLREKPVISKAKVLVFAQEGFETQALNHIMRLADQDEKCEHCILDTLDEAKEYAKNKKIARIDVISEHITTIEVEGVN